MSLTDVSLKRPVFAFVVIIALVALGIVGLLGLSINDMPEVDIPYMGVSVSLPGASPDQVESKITKKVEETIGQISGVKHITSTVSEGYSFTFIEFTLEKPQEEASQDVRTKLDAIRGTLPQDIDEPVITKFDIDARPILSLVVTGKQQNNDLSELVDDTITKRLNTVSGVGSIDVYGDKKREIQIRLDKEKLAALNLTTAEVLSGLRKDNLDIPSGKVSDGSREITLRTYSSIKNVNDFNDILLATRNGSEIRVRDVAEVVDGFKDQTSLSYYEGKECIGIDIVKQSGANTVAVSDNLKKELASIESALPAGVKIHIVNDNSKDIRESVRNVEKTMIEGCILAVIIVFLFLRRLGSTAISAISLPTSIITTFAILKFMNFTLNFITLGALSLAVGLLIDDSIVVIENIVRHIRMGKTPLQAAKEATSEIGLAVMSTTFSVVAIFLPIAMTSGLIGRFLVEFGLTVIFSVLVSLFVSFTLAPLLSSRYLEAEESGVKGPVGRFLAWFNRLFDLLAGYYQRLLSKVLNRRAITLAVVSVLFLLSLALIPQMGTGFSPNEDRGWINISAGLDSGLALDEADKKARIFEKIVRKNPEVRYIYTTVQPDSISLGIKLTDKEDRKESADEIGVKMREELRKVPGIDLSVVTSPSVSLSSGKMISYHIKGDDFNQLLEYSQKAKQIMNHVPGAVDVGLSCKAGKPEERLDVDRDVAADLGVSPAAVSDTLNTLYNGVVAGQYETEEDRYDVRVRLKDEQRKNLDSLDGIYIPSSNPGSGGLMMIPLEQVTRKVFTTSSSTINRYDKSREIQLQANYTGISMGTFSNLFMKKLNSELKTPKGISIGAGEDQAMMMESALSMLQAMLLGILFMFLILSAQFESFLDPLVIMFALPLAIIGAVLALFVTGSDLTVVGGIGIIMLLGLVSKNAILLVDFIKQQRSAGVERKGAILNAGLIRLRPILMTTLAMIFGMLPSALAMGTGSEMRQPMAFAIIGGLISSTLLTLLIVPIIYTVVDDLRNSASKKKKLKVVAKAAD
ncbi:MAG TPA: AcrB/AcrD/AcrF family protein [Desulfotomaculum sp.]|nr:MAG: AcrB/AcrD/AcrF family protein [Desulfotomaculum sp. 46_80]HAG11085.1 AcrB/AcrD/AcrF family protein [Desulfotomaculum sp.]HBY03601.1 AcrB/AcrD/AcrF family protein [Desulfotomaculum sp.]